MHHQTERRLPLSRERVLRSAITLADEGGIDSLSMRKLGQTLGVEAMSLYNHVANKDDILDGMVNLVLREFELPAAGQDWEHAIRRCAISAHEALVRHPWASSLIMGGARIRPERLRYIEALLSTLRQAGFSAEATYHAYHALDSHILGFTLWQLGHVMPGDMPRLTTREELTTFLATLLGDFSFDHYPYLLEHTEQHLADGSHKEEGEFEFGLRLILDGLKRMRGSDQLDQPPAKS